MFGRLNIGTLDLRTLCSVVKIGIIGVFYFDGMLGRRCKRRKQKSPEEGFGVTVHGKGYLRFMASFEGLRGDWRDFDLSRFCGFVCGDGIVFGVTESFVPKLVSSG